MARNYLMAPPGGGGGMCTLVHPRGLELTRCRLWCHYPDTGTYAYIYLYDGKLRLHPFP